MKSRIKNNKEYAIRALIIKAGVALLLFIAPFLIATAQDGNGSNGDGWVVVIDPGHGGKDPGTVGRRSREKDIVLAIALKTGNYIEELLPGVKVIYTRKTDVFIELDKRADIANKAKADLFISIHVNAISDSRIRGSETFAMGLHKNEGNLQVAMKENSVITLEKDYTTKYQGYDPNSSESYIAFSLMQNIYLEQSLYFASFIQNQFRERVGLRDRGVKQAGFVVLSMTTMPSVLVEAGFSSNSEEERLLLSEQGQDYIASAIFRAFRDYKDAVDKKSGFTPLRDDFGLADQSQIDFRVQIATSSTRQELKSENFGSLRELSELVSGKYYKYASGHFKTYPEASDYRRSILSQFPDAFVIAVRNSEIMPLQEAIEETGSR
ncbi:MAG: N-acetylmuramoyl-L-alanine amidase [Bacteroidales bacterium]|nr:N-acetylmuramoyl-L-alanine amidase [Bacteroidales bacterium]